MTNINCTPEQLCIDVTEELKKIITEELNVGNSIIELEYEKKFNRFISVAMKNYAGIRDGKNVPDIKGLDCVKKSTIKIAKEGQKNLLHDLLLKNYSLTFYQDKVEKLKTEFYNTRPHVDDIVQRTSISKHPKDLKTLQPHARVAMQLIEDQREFYIGMQIPYIITDKKNKGAVHVDDYNGLFDRDYYWERLYAPIQRVLAVCFPTFDWSIYGKTKRVSRKKKEIEKVKEVPKKRGFIKKKGGFILKKKISRFVIKQTEHNQLQLGD